MEMLTGQALGDALKRAIELKGASQQRVATDFGVRQSSVAGWIKSGRIAKRHLVKLVHYFGDVVGPEHWGLPPTWAAELSPEAMALASLLDQFEPAERLRIVPVLVALLGQLRRHPGASVAFTLIAAPPPSPHPTPPPPAGADGAATPAPTVVPIRPPAPHR
jgi:hypothetical protein